MIVVSLTDVIRGVLSRFADLIKLHREGNANLFGAEMDEGFVWGWEDKD